MASPLLIETENIQKDIIDPGPFGVKSLFQSAHRFGGSTLKRIVLTSSAVTMMNPFWPKEQARATRWNEDDWTPVTSEQAVEAKNPGLGYLATKALAERAAWDFIETEKPTFDLTTLLPVAVLGPVQTPVKSPAQIERFSALLVYSLFNSTRKTAEAAEADHFVFSHIDVRDVARAHVQSLTLPAASNQRISISTEEIFSPQTILNMLNKHFPELKDRVATGKPDQLFSAGLDPTLFTGEKAKRIFGNAWARSVETTVKDITAQLLEQEKGF
jgi:nucleoside-diphosphate-sugar epimerase